MRICPFCSTENEAFFRFCLGCGADLDEALGGEEQVASPPPGPPAPTLPPRSSELPAVDLLRGAAGKSPTSGLVSAKDTIVDAPAITPEMLAQAARGDKTGKGGRAGVAPREPKDRDKTLESGGQMKPGSAASQAVALAQAEVRHKAGPTEQVGGGAAVAARGVAAAAAGSPAAKAGKGAVLKGAPPAPPPAKVEDDVGPGSDEPVRTRPTPVSSRGLSRPSAPPREVSTRRAGGSPEVAPPTSKRATPKTKARLVIILEDGTDGTALELTPPSTIIGREGVDISFPHDDFLAKRHAEVKFADGAVFLNPLESTNGVFLQVHQEVELESGDVFRIGQQLLIFELLSAVAASLEVDPHGQAIPLGSPVPEGAWGRLGQLIAPETLGSVYLLGGSEVYLGRERGDITFPGDGFVSGLHAQISMRGGRCYLKDLGSSNGTYIRLSKSAPVRHGMLVLAGQQLFRVEL